MKYWWVAQSGERLCELRLYAEAETHYAEKVAGSNPAPPLYFQEPRQ